MSLDDFANIHLPLCDSACTRTRTGHDGYDRCHVERKEHENVRTPCIWKIPLKSEWHIGYCAEGNSISPRSSPLELYPNAVADLFPSQCLDTEVLLEYPI